MERYLLDPDPRRFQPRGGRFWLPYKENYRLRRTEKPASTSLVLPFSEIFRHARARVLALWRTQLAGAIIIAVGTFLVAWVASDFSESVWDQVTTVAIYPTVAVVAWLVASGAWHLWRAPVHLARESAASHAQRMGELEQERDDACARDAKQRRAAAQPDADALWLSEQLFKGNDLLAQWGEHVSREVEQRLWPEAATWEQETRDGLVARIPAYAGHFGVDVGLGYEFAQFALETRERTRLRRRIQRLAEIMERYERGRGA